MDRIKFRAWEKNLKEMIEVYNIDFVSKMINRDIAFRFFDEVELMQYTGLKDKNGKEIYEGDIIKFTDNYNTDIPEKIGVVKFNNASFYITDGAYSCYRWIDINIEIIGNIYENPDLLEDN